MRRLDRHRHARQLDLFRPDRPSLEWRQLQEDVRGTVAGLMARLLREQLHPRANDGAAGGRDDE